MKTPGVADAPVEPPSEEARAEQRRLLAIALTKHLEPYLRDHLTRLARAEVTALLGGAFAQVAAQARTAAWREFGDTLKSRAWSGDNPIYIKDVLEMINTHHQSQCDRALVRPTGDQQS